MRVLFCGGERDSGDAGVASVLKDLEVRGLTVDRTVFPEHVCDSVRNGAHDVYVVASDDSSNTVVDLAALGRPLVVLSRGERPGVDAAAVRAGASLVLLRQALTTEVLERALRYAASELDIMGTRRASFGLVDREVLEGRLDLAVENARRGGRAVSVMAVLIHPAQAGTSVDAALVPDLTAQVVRRLRRGLAVVDTTTLTGPLEFLVLLERLDEGPFSVHIADQLLTEIRNPFQVGDAPVELRASIGISLYPGDGEDGNTLVQCADAAARAAQIAGGDLFGFFSGSVNEASARRVALERAVVEALWRDEFRLVYQPQVDIRSGRAVGAEALLRWTTPKLGSVSPGEFIPILEANGHVADVGAWVLEQACIQGCKWANAGTPIRVSVNVSARQLRNAGFDIAVTEVLRRTGLEPSLLELELTESVLIENPTKTREALGRLREIGVRIAIDDFGTGYASLSYLRNFPMDTIKIDRQFVRGLPIHVENAAITSAIATLAHALGLHLVAEGVETEAEQEFLRSLECSVIQGFLHARPMPGVECTAWVRSRS